MSFAGAVFLAAVVALSSATNATLFLLTEPAAQFGAVCLDGESSHAGQTLNPCLQTSTCGAAGSPSGYYFSPGTDSGANKWIVFHEGGGWCSGVEDCLGRSGTDLGSSKHYPATMIVDGYGGYLSSSASINPQMYTWNKVGT